MFIQPVSELSLVLNTVGSMVSKAFMEFKVSSEILPKLIYCLDVAHPQLCRHGSSHNIWLLFFLNLFCI